MLQTNGLMTYMAEAGVDVEAGRDISFSSARDVTVTTDEATDGDIRLLVRFLDVSRGEILVDLSQALFRTLGGVWYHFQ